MKRRFPHLRNRRIKKHRNRQPNRPMKKKLTQAILSAIRHGLNAGSAALVTIGATSQEQADAGVQNLMLGLEPFVIGLVGLGLAFAWSLMEKQLLSFRPLKKLLSNGATRLLAYALIFTGILYLLPGCSSRSAAVGLRLEDRELSAFVRLDSVGRILQQRFDRRFGGDEAEPPVESIITPTESSK